MAETDKSAASVELVFSEDPRGKLPYGAAMARWRASPERCECSPPYPLRILNRTVSGGVGDVAICLGCGWLVVRLEDNTLKWHRLDPIEEN